MLLKLQNYHSENIPTIYKKLNSFYFWCKYEYQRKQIWIEGIYVRAEYRRKDEKNLYDVLLNDYEKGMDIEKLDIFFNELKKEIVPFLKKIQEKKKSLKEENKIDVPVDEDIQFKFAKYLANYVGFDFEKGIIETSEHPFTLNLNKNDVRLTTNNKKDTPFSTVTDKFSTPGLSSAMCWVTALDASSSLEKTFLPMSLTKSNKPILKFLLYICLRDYYDTEIPLRSP